MGKILEILDEKQPVHQWGDYESPTKKFQALLEPVSATIVETKNIDNVWSM